ncbi:uncharacterized protein [Hyperolius riggenbachi]|uniref:uncharacterized protein n=1 Tax=Hyperolius riggenbachi TaxID=752182 RepID=UPI0035A2B23F
MTRLVIVNIFYLLLIAHAMAEDLEVTIGTSPIPTLRGENVTIPCNITNIDDKKPIRIEWKKTLENGTEKVVHDYEGGRMTAHREGSYMDVEEILKGNAELYLPNIQISDDGEYTCNVTNTPRYTSSKTDLQVSVLPHVMTTLRHVSTKQQKETSLTCEVTNFYPKTMTVRWVRYIKDSSGYVILKGPRTTSPIANSDGTFNTTSHLTLRSEEADDEGSYGCVVKLRDFELVNNIAVPEKSKIWLILGPIMLALAIKMLICRFKNVAPSLYVINEDDHLIHMLRTTLTFAVMKYKPPGITVSVGLRRPGQQEEETIITCKTSDKNNILQSTEVVTAKEEEHLLQPELCLTVTKDKYFVCFCECSLSITPSYEDNGAELSVHVTHRKLKSPISMQRTLNVRGLPVAGELTSDPTIGEYGKPLNLNWRVTGCDINKIIKVTWADGGGKLVRGIQNETRGPGESLDCTLKITPTAEDYGRTYICSVHYKDMQLPFTRNLTLRLPAPEHQTHNENVPSVCIINGPHQHNEKNSHYVKEEEGDISHSFTSSPTLKPTVNKDDGVTTNYGTFHPATQTEAEKELTVRPTGFPQLDEIQKKQEVIYFGEELDLSCRIHTFNPADITVTWYMDDSPLPSERREPIREPSTGLYHVTTNVSYTPTTFEWKTFRCEVQQGTADPRHVTWTLKDLSFPPQRI